MQNKNRLQEIESEIKDLRKIIQEKEEKDPTNSWPEFSNYMKPEWDKLANLEREQRMLIIPDFDKEIIGPEYGDLMSIKDFIDSVKKGGFIDSDGYGNYVRDGKRSNITIHPSDIQYNAIRTDFDTIIWFNK